MARTDQVARTARTRGATIFYKVTGEGPPLLLISGLGAEHSMWALQVDSFAEHFTVISFDNRKIGESSGGGLVPWIETMASDAAAVLDDAGYGRAHVVGMSMGGFIAQTLAVTFPRRVSKLVLTCTAAVRPIPRLRGGFRGMFFSPEFRRDHPERVSRWSELVRRDQPQVNAVLGQLVASALFDLRSEVSKIEVPTLVVHGTKDLLVPAECGRWLAEHIPGAELVLLEGAGHAVPIERAVEYNRLVVDFLSRE